MSRFDHDNDSRACETAEGNIPLRCYVEVKPSGGGLTTYFVDLGGRTT
jgi:hypothetical protein